MVEQWRRSFCRKDKFQFLLSREKYLFTCFKPKKPIAVILHLLRIAQAT